MKYTFKEKQEIQNDQKQIRVLVEKYGKEDVLRYINSKLNEDEEENYFDAFSETDNKRFKAMELFKQQAPDLIKEYNDNYQEWEEDLGGDVLYNFEELEFIQRVEKFIESFSDSNLISNIVIDKIHEINDNIEELTDNSDDYESGWQVYPMLLSNEIKFIDELFKSFNNDTLYSKNVVDNFIDSLDELMDMFL